ncbi:MAG: PmoA family protein [Armatimonadetes bacterium]|nr:PmoA family protein [Armatimonadota bacterium]
MRSIWHSTGVALAVIALGALASVPARAAGAFSIERTGKDYLLVSEGRTPVFRYVLGEILAPGMPEDRRRSSYVHPLYALDGVTELTADFPVDHPHHRGLSWMWQQVSFAESPSSPPVTKDLWTLKGMHQKFSGRYSAQVTDRVATLSVHNGWFDDASGKKIVDEDVKFTVYRAMQARRAIDFELTLSAVDGPVTIATSQTGYSGLGVRFADRTDTALFSADGAVVKDENKISHTWADLSGRFAGKDTLDGVSILQSRRNPYFPDGWCLRYYGYLSPSFTNKTAGYTILPDEPLTLRYRLYVHTGRPDSRLTRTLLEQYNH